MGTILLAWVIGWALGSVLGIYLANLAISYVTDDQDRK